jgi:hypothetical protein
MTIRELPPDEIGKRLKSFCELCDIAPPADGAALVQFMKYNYGSLKEEVLSRALNHWAATENDIQRPRKLNGHFVAAVFKLYLDSKRAQNSNDAYAKPERKLLEAPKDNNIRKRELLEALSVLKYRYNEVFYKKNNQTYILIGAMESLHAEAIEFGLYQQDDFDESLVRQKEQAIRDYVYRTQLGINRSKPTWMLDTGIERTNHTYWNSAYMCLYFDNLIFADGL